MSRASAALWQASRQVRRLLHTQESCYRQLAALQSHSRQQDESRYRCRRPQSISDQLLITCELVHLREELQQACSKSMLQWRRTAGGWLWLLPVAAALLPTVGLTAYSEARAEENQTKVLKRHSGVAGFPVTRKLHFRLLLRAWRPLKVMEVPAGLALTGCQHQETRFLQV